MPLRFELSDIRDLELNYPAPEGGGLHVATQALVIATMHVGLSHIADDTWKEFAVRLEITQTLHEPIAYLPDDTGALRLVGADDVHGHIGLATNALNYSRADWLTALIEPRIEQRIRWLTQHPPR